MGQPISAMQKLPFARPSCLSRAGVGRQRDRDLDSRGGVVVALINRVPSISTRAMRHVAAHVLPYGTTQTISLKHVLNCRKHPRDPRLPSICPILPGLVSGLLSSVLSICWLA
jgi:hypothetical protein